MISTQKLALLVSLAGGAVISAPTLAYAASDAQPVKTDAQTTPETSNEDSANQAPAETSNEDSASQAPADVQSGDTQSSEKAAAPASGPITTTSITTTSATPAVTGEVSPSVESVDTIPPALKINGFTLFNTYVVKQADQRNGKGGAPLHFGMDASSLYFTITGKARGLEYMYRISLDTYVNSSPTISQNYLQFKTDFYAFRLGNTVGPEDFARKDAGSIIGGAGGFEVAAYEKVYNLSAGILKGSKNIYETGKATKIVFMGPEYKGFQFFAAYTPNTARRGDDAKGNLFPDNTSIPGNSKGMYAEKRAYPYGINNWSLGLNYKTAGGPWSLALFGTAMTEHSYYTVTSAALPIQRFKLKNGWVYQAGGILGYDRWEFAAGYLNNGKARLPKIANMPLNTSGSVHTGDMHQGNSGQAFNTGLAYTVGAYQFAGAYQHFWRKTDAVNRAKNNVFTGTVDVNVFRGLKVYFELDFIRSKSNKACMDLSDAMNVGLGSSLKQHNQGNSGTVAILGTKISF